MVKKAGAASKAPQATTKPKVKVKPTPNDARVWLRENGYKDVAKMIDKVMESWAEEGKTTRRNWWDTLAGGTNGTPYTIGGVEFPVLVCAQKRQGKPVTANAIQRSLNEKPPPVRETGRWPARS